MRPFGAYCETFGKGLVRASAPFLFGVCLCVGAARAEVICTLVADVETGAVLVQEGDCDTRMTPASTFKLPLAVIAFEAGLLESARIPRLSYAPGDPDWGGENWTRDTTPRDWLRYSVVWYSQRLTRALGAALISQSLADFGYGNADMSGDDGAQDGLERAWLSSSLKVSPREQVTFLRGLVAGTLPVSAEAMAQTRNLVAARLDRGWRMQGKTGGAYPRLANGAFDRARGIGWYVGWARKDGKTVVFARLTQATAPQEQSPGLSTRAQLEAEWSDMMARLAE